MALLLQDGQQNLTVFVPPSEDLLALGSGLQSGRVSLQVAQTIVLAHIVNEYLPIEELAMMDGADLSSAGGTPVRIDVLSPLGVLDGEQRVIALNNSVVRALARPCYSACEICLNASCTCFFSSFPVNCLLPFTHSSARARAIRGLRRVQVAEADMDGCSASGVIHHVSELILPGGVYIDLSAYQTQYAPAPHNAPELAVNDAEVPAPTPMLAPGDQFASSLASPPSLPPVPLQPPQPPPPRPPVPPPPGVVEVVPSYSLVITPFSGCKPLTGASLDACVACERA